MNVSGHSSVGRAFDCSGKLYWIQYGFRNQMATGSIPVDRTLFFTLSSPFFLVPSFFHLPLHVRDIYTSQHSDSSRLSSHTTTTRCSDYPMPHKQTYAFSPEFTQHDPSLLCLVYFTRKAYTMHPRKHYNQENHILLQTLSCQSFCRSCSLVNLGQKLLSSQ